MHHTGSKLSLLLAGSCVLGCGAVGYSRACDVWGGIACAVLGRCAGVDVRQSKAFGSCSSGATTTHAGLGCGFVVATLGFGRAAGRGVSSGSCQTGGVDLGIGSAEFFDQTRITAALHASTSGPRVLSSNWPPPLAAERTANRRASRRNPSLPLPLALQPGAVWRAHPLWRDRGAPAAPLPCV